LLAKSQREFKVLELLRQRIGEGLLLEVALVKEAHMILRVVPHLLILTMWHLLVHSVLTVVTPLILIVSIVTVVAEVAGWANPVESAASLIATPATFVASMKLLGTLLVVAVSTAIIGLHRITFLKLIIKLARQL
jgi:hypothetical protein